MAIAMRFQIEEVYDRVITENIHTSEPVPGKKDMYRFKSETVTRTVPVSYNVYFPAGHSLWFETKEQMERAGVLEDANQEIDTETGQTVAPPITDLKALVAKKTRDPRNANVRM